MNFQNELQFATQLDEQDELKNFRNEFIIPTYNDKEAIYFLGNSLGLQPKRTEKYIQQVLQQWSDFGVEGFFKGEKPWLHYHDELIKPLSKIIGALPQEIVVMNQLTVNLHLMLVSFYHPTEKRKKILCEAKAFPSDQYALHSHVRQRGFNPDDVIIEVHPRGGKQTLNHADIISAIEQNAEELALVLFGGVHYYSGQVLDMKTIVGAAHKVGALVGFDLAHAVGNIPLQLHDWNVDFACWCSYKYLNSGPGAVGGLYIHERYHNDSSLNRFAGWWGNKKETQFLMEKNFDPASTAEGWQLSTPSPILFAAHKAALEIFEEAGINKLHQKRKLLSDYLLFLLDEVNQTSSEKIIEIITPRNENEKGCQVSMLMLKNGKKIFDTLSTSGVFADWREPDVIRIAPVPLYNTFEEVWQFAQILKEAINEPSANR